MQRMTTALGVVLFALALPAQGREAKPALAGFDRLVAEWKATNTAYRTALKELQATDDYKAARAAKDYDKLRALSGELQRPDAGEFGGRTIELADQYAGDDRLRVLVYAATTFRDQGVVQDAVERIERDFLSSAGLTVLMENAMTVSRNLGPEKGPAFLDRVIAENEHPMPRAWAMYWKGYQLQRNKEATDAEKELAGRLLAEAEQLAAGTDLADRIAAPRFEEERLQVGMAVPEVEGEDVDGVAFKLSDYRGKVVLLDFWGFW